MVVAKPACATPPRLRPDRYEATLGGVGFVIHRDKPANWLISNLANPRYDILAFAVSGRAHYRIEDRDCVATRGTMLYFPRGVLHSATSDPLAPWSFYSVGFALQPANDQTRLAYDALPRHQLMANVTQIRGYFQQLETLWNSAEHGFSIACRGLTLLLLQQYVATAQRGHSTVPHAQRLEAIVAAMHANVGRVESVGTLARRAHLSESRFRMLFSRLTGCSVTLYQNRLRIQAARDMLTSGHYTVGTVAEELGFRDVYYFSRLFKRITGTPPSTCFRR